MTGFLEPRVLDTFKDDNGSSFREAASAVGFSAATAQARSYAVPSAAHADLKLCMHLPRKLLHSWLANVCRFTWLI